MWLMLKSETTTSGKLALHRKLGQAVRIGFVKAHSWAKTPVAMAFPMPVDGDVSEGISLVN